MKLISHFSANVQTVAVAIGDDLALDASAVVEFPRHGAGTAVTEAISNWDVIGPALERTLTEISENEDEHRRLLATGALRPLSALELTAPVGVESKVICVGANYLAHADESGLSATKNPELFAKYFNSIVAAGEGIVFPRVTTQVDYEVELAVVIGRRAKYVSTADALSYVFGYTILNDVSMRDYQFGSTQWLAGKSFDRSTPVGPWIVTADEIGDPQTLELSLTVNGTELQRANTSQMIRSVAELVSFISSVMTLEPGDLVATGTPDGVGVFREPQVWLASGDVVRASVEGIGTLENPVVPEADLTEAAA